MTVATPTLDRIRANGSLRVAVEWKDPQTTGFPPEMYLEEGTGKPWGIIPIISGMMAHDLGVEVEFVVKPWPDHIPLLLSGATDFLFNTNTPGRAITIDYVTGRLMANRVLCLVPQSSPITSIDEVNCSTVKVAHWHGSSIGGVVRNTFPDVTVVESGAPYDDVIEGRADVCVNDSITHRFMELNPGLRIVHDEAGGPAVLSREYVHIGTRHGDAQFKSWLENWYEYHSSQGTIQRWCSEWWESYIVDGAAAGKGCVMH